MVTYTAVFRALADFGSPIRESGRLAQAFDKARVAADKVGPSVTAGAKSYADLQKTSATAVSNAARIVSTARAAEEAGSRRVRIAELRLQELRAGGKAKASVLAGAEDRLVRSQQALAAAQARTASATQHYGVVQEHANTALSAARVQAERAGGSSRKLARGIAAASAASGELGRSMTTGITIPLAIIGTLGVRTYAKFERAIVSAGSKSDATTEQLERMKQKALDVGNTTRYSATQAATAMDELAAAGFNAEDAMATLLPVTLAAQAANEDLGLTAKVTATTMNAFNIPTARAAHVADVLANSLNTTALTMNGLEDALGQAGEIGPRFNQSLEDTVAVIGRLVDQGVPAASAGTAIRQALTSLSAPTQQANQLINDLGLELRGANGELKPIPDLVRELKDGLQAGNPQIKAYSKTIGMSNTELKDWAKQNNITLRQAKQIQTAISQGGAAFNDYATKTLFGVEGAKAFSLAMAEGKPLIIDTSKESEKLTRLTEGLSIKMGRNAANAFVKAHTSMGVFTATSADAVEAVSALGLASDGTAAKIGAAFQTTTAQKIDNLKGSVETLAITLIQLLKPSIDKNIDGVREFVTGISHFAEANPLVTKLALGFLAIFAAVGPGLFVFAKLVGAVQLVNGAFRTTQAAAQTASTWIQMYGEAAGKASPKVAGLASGASKVVSFLGGPWGIAIGLAVAALGFYVAKQQQAKKETEAFTKTLEFQNGALTDSSKATLAKQLADDGALSAAVKAGVAEADYTDALVKGGQARQDMINALKATAQEHTRVVQTGYGAQVAIDDTGKAADQAATSLQNMGSGMDAQRKASEQAARAIQVNAENTARLNQYLKDQGGAVYTAAEKSKELNAAHKELKNTEDGLSAATQQVINKFTILRSGALNAAQANDAWEASLDAVKDSVKENGRSLDDGTAKGRANRAVIRGMVTALNDKVAADVKAKGSTKGATEELRKGAIQIRKTGREAGLSKEKVNQMVKEYLKTPKQLKTDVKIPGADEAKKKAKNLKEQIEKLKNKKVDATVTFSSNADSFAKKMGFALSGGSENSNGGGSAQQNRAEGGPIVKTRKQSFKAGGRVQNLSGKGRRAYDTEDAVLRVDEHVWTPEEVDGAGGHAKVQQLRAAAKKKQLHFAQGGVVRRRVDVNTTANKVPNVAGADKPIGELALKGAKTFLTKIADQLDKKFKKALASGPIGGGGYAKALAFAKSQVGKPYVFGAAGPNGYDCSGFMAAIQNVIEGKSVYRRRYSTPAFHGDSAQGFTRNKKSPFMIGVNPAPGKSGHMAGTLNGKNVESAGGVGVRVGGSARGYNAGMFSWRGGLAEGGPVVPGIGGDLPYDTTNPHGERFDPWMRALAKAVYGQRAYAKGTRQTTNGLHLAGEHGMEMIRTRAGADIMNSRQTLDYLSKIEALAVKAPKDLAAAAPSGLSKPKPVERSVGDVNVPVTVMYAKDKEISTMAAQRALVRGGRKVAAIAAGGS